MAGGIPVLAGGEERDKREDSLRRGVPLVFQGSVRWGLIPDRGGEGSIDPVHAQAVACADALEEHLLDVMRKAVTLDRWIVTSIAEERDEELPWAVWAAERADAREVWS